MPDALPRPSQKGVADAAKMVGGAGQVTENTSSPRLLVFDLDGTLIDSRRDLTNSVNAMLEHFGKAALDPVVVASYIGDGVSALVRRALAHTSPMPSAAQADQLSCEEAVVWFLDYYRVHKLDYTYVYPGVFDALNDIRARHPALPMAVLTNKPVGPSRAICSHLNLERFFFQNYGGNSFSTKKPDPQGLLTLIYEASSLAGSISAAETVMIGDSHVDIQTARAAGAGSLGCSFGLSPESLASARPDALVDHASDWPAALGL